WRPGGPRGRAPPRGPRGASRRAPLLSRPPSRGRVTGPVEVIDAPAQARTRLLVAERARDPGLVERSWREAERLRRLVVASEIGVEHGRVVGRDRAADARRGETGQRMVGEARHRPGAEVRERADVEDDAAVGELADEPGVLLGADAVTKPVGAERLERPAHRGRTGDLAGVRHRSEP